MFEVRTILHPTDFSENSARAFSLACTLAREHKARVIVLHVGSGGPRPVSSYGAVVIPKGGQVDDEPDWRELSAIQSAEPGILVERRLEHGSPVMEILRVASEAKCDLIVMGTHGRTGFQRLLLGSVAEQVVRLASCPVLTVKPADFKSPEVSEPPAKEATPTVQESVPRALKVPQA